jgi:hypothetical protein
MPLVLHYIGLALGLSLAMYPLSLAIKLWRMPPKQIERDPLDQS